VGVPLDTPRRVYEVRLINAPSLQGERRHSTTVPYWRRPPALTLTMEISKYVGYSSGRSCQPHRRAGECVTAAADQLITDQDCCFEKYNNMSTNNSDKGITTVAIAAGSALFGAVLAVGAMKMMEKNVGGDKGATSDKLMQDRPSIVFSAGDLHSKRSSYIFNDEESRPTILFPHNHEDKMKMRISQRVAVEQEHSLPRRSVTVKVPATTANMGPGCKLP
jgi:hypothetical protein